MVSVITGVAVAVLVAFLVGVGVAEVDSTRGLGSMAGVTVFWGVFFLGAEQEQFSIKKDASIMTIQIVRLFLLVFILIPLSFR